MHIVTFLAADGFAVAGLGLTAMIFVAIGLLLSVFWIWMLIDCLSSSLPPTEKLIWFLVIFFLHILGAVLYYAMARSSNRPGIV